MAATLCTCCSIVPPHMLRHLVEHGDDREKSRAMRTLLGGAHIRGKREALGAFAVGSPAGTLHRTIFDAKHGIELPGVMIRNEGDPASSDDAVNQAYDALGATYNFYEEVFQRNSIDNKGMRMDASVHYNVDFDNAFWNGERMVFGDGDGSIFVGFTRALDVIGHELTHGVTQYEAGLEYQDQPGALNESMSDVFGSLVKQYALHQDAESADWLIGAGILAPGIHGVALRSMKAPGTAYDDPRLGTDPQPATMHDYVNTPDDNGGVHINSGIPNRAFFLVATELGGNAWEDAGQIWYTTLRRLHPQSNFQDCANTTYSVAGELFGAGGKQQQAVRSAWSEVGIRIAGAPRVAAHPRRAANGRATSASVPTGDGADGAALLKRLDTLTSELQRLVEVLGKTPATSKARG